MHFNLRKCERCIEWPRGAILLYLWKVDNCERGT
jgi:hypothetical protein